jgi:hypothetical protein
VPCLKRNTPAATQSHLILHSQYNQPQRQRKHIGKHNSTLQREQIHHTTSYFTRNLEKEMQRRRIETRHKIQRSRVALYFLHDFPDPGGIFPLLPVRWSSSMAHRHVAVVGVAARTASAVRDEGYEFLCYLSYFLPLLNSTRHVSRHLATSRDISRHLATSRDIS